MSTVNLSEKLRSTTYIDRSSPTNGLKEALSSRPSSSLVLEAFSTFVEFFRCYACKFVISLKCLSAFLIIFYSSYVKNEVHFCNPANAIREITGQN